MTTKRNILLAIDSFKGCATSAQLSDWIMRACAPAYSELKFDAVAVADGGEGFTDALRHRGDVEVALTVHDPQMRPRSVCYRIARNDTAVLEIASAIGLTLVPVSERTPWLTSSYGAGELIADAFSRGCRHFVVGLGGSATNDAGMGLFQALGFRFLDAQGQELPGIGASLERLDRIDDSRVSPLLRRVTFEVACDVDSLFYGEEGAACVFAVQKGADAEHVARLDAGLRRFADIVRRYNGFDLSTLASAGAAGGIGGGMAALLGARLRRGVEVVFDHTDFDKRLSRAALVITGEGQLDSQTLLGKMPYGVLQRAQARGIPVVAIAGRVTDREALLEAGFADLFEISPRDIPLEEAMQPQTTRENLERMLRRPEFVRHLLG